MDVSATSTVFNAPIPSKGHEMANDEIYQRIQVAIMERRLAPGTKLAEERLTEATGASRAKVRQVLSRLAHEKVVTLIPNRGAFIARPTTQEARELFTTRRLIEPGMVDLLARQVTPAQVRTLRRHVAQEQEARNANDLRRIIRLSGEFHIHIADMVASSFLPRIMRELTALTCLIITLYDKPNTPACPHHEHRDLVDMIEAHDSAGAKQCMLDHLLHIEHALDLDSTEPAPPDFDAIFKHDEI
ncbi:DNA-binding GntR family transcriptional regulator [Paralcaligenes ureilyticus]|uniref:DNA-binding GntR family transcriptional regulator n=2 Tax=Paralcaligenes ureilyticus TaxID=627131 RepID=A0A4R3LNM0_9BURK|nr:DNA-binding GntR family transcriptional regulator [Paralcaligenes ureilyticus]